VPADPDVDLVARAIARDAEAVRTLVRQLGPIIRGRVAKALYRRKSTRDQRRDVGQEIADLTQEVFLALFDDDAKALRAWNSERGPLGGFVALLADHQVYSIFRSGRRRPWSDDLDVLAEPEASEAEAKSPETRVASKQTLDVILARMRADLTPKGYEVFVRLYVEEQSVEQVSRELAMTADAIYAWRTRLSKAVRAIAGDLEREGVSETTASPRTSSLEGDAP